MSSSLLQASPGAFFHFAFIRRGFRTLLGFALILLLASPAMGQWSSDPSENLVIADRPEGQTQPKIVATDDGGFYVSWFGAGADGFDVYLQRLDAYGVAQWGENGIRVADRSYSSTEDYGLAVDPAGNALLVFRFPDGNGTTQAVVQRISAEGNFQWDAPGLFVSNETNAAASPRVAATDDGGLVVAWTSFTSGSIVLQKVGSNGAMLWGEGGVSVEVPTGAFFIADLHADGQGNVIVSGSAQLATFDRRLWAQKLNGLDGTAMWGDDPVQVFNGSDGALQFGYFPPFIPDGAGGGVFAWYQVAGVSEARVRVQHVTADGTPAFAQNGVDAATGTERQRGAPAATYDSDTGDIYVVWPEEQQIGADPRTYGVSSQRIDASGSRQWGNDGQTLVPMGDAQASQVSALPMDFGAVFAWALDTYPNPMRIDAARLHVTGDFVWDEQVVALKTAESSNTRMRGALSAQGYAAYAWADGPGGSSPERILGQNVTPAGQLGTAEPPQAVVEPTELLLVMAPDQVQTAVITLSNVASSGAADLQYAVSMDQTRSVLIDFEDNEIPHYLTLGIPVADYVAQTGGNPGRWMRNSSVATFAPRLYIGPAESPFTGNFVERKVEQISVDGRTVEAAFGVQERPFSIMLIKYNGEPNNPEAHHYVYYPGPLAPQVGAGWSEYVFEIPYDYEGTLPEGWSGGHYGDPESLPPGVTWQDIISEVDEVNLVWGHPAFFYLLQDFDFGVDNVGVVYQGDGDGPITAHPLEGYIPAGDSQELTLTVDSEGVEPGEHVYALVIETNDPENPEVTVQVTLQVQAVSIDEDAAPSAFALAQNYPNPFASRTTIGIALPESGHLTLEVFDITGRRVATLFDGALEAGTHEVSWDAQRLPSGTYVYRAQAGGQVLTQRALVVR